MYNFVVPYCTSLYFFPLFGKIHKSQFIEIKVE